MEDYMPTTDEVRDAYIDRKGFEDQILRIGPRGDAAAGAEFDRWLAEHDARLIEAWLTEHGLRRVWVQHWHTVACPVGCNVKTAGQWVGPLEVVDP